MLKKIKGIKNLQSMIQNQIKLYIINSKLKSGDPIPTEKELAESLGTSRTSIREALITLESLGIIETKHGIGSFVGNFNFEVILNNLPYKLELDIDNFLDILEIRLCLESHFLTKYINNYSTSDIQKLKKIVDDLEGILAKKNNKKNPLINKHTEFHCSLYLKSKNLALINLIKIFSTVQQNLTILHQYEKEAESKELFIDRHRKIIEAIELKNSVLVQKRLVEHFIEAKKWAEQKNKLRKDKKYEEINE